VRPLLAVGVVLALLGPVAPAADAITVENGLVFTRPDGTRVDYPSRVRVWCGPWEPDVPVRSLHVQVGVRGGPYWRLSAVVADVTRRPVIRLPHSFVFDRPTGALLFATDGTNELSSAEEEAAGRLVFRRARCGPRMAVRVRVRATLGSEFSDGAPLLVRGTFTAAK
jgi:hypothetical protein